VTVSETARTQPLIAETRAVAAAPTTPPALRLRMALRLLHACLRLADAPCPRSCASRIRAGARGGLPPRYTALLLRGAASCHARCRLLELPVRRDDADLAAFLDARPGKITMLYRRDRDLAAISAHPGRRLPRALGLEEAAAGLGLARGRCRRPAGRRRELPRHQGSLRRELALARLAKQGESVAPWPADLGIPSPRRFSSPCRLDREAPSAGASFSSRC